jgi:starch phosphorylase
MAARVVRALLPRHLEIIFEINRRLLDDVRRRFPGDEGRVARTSLIEEGRASTSAWPTSPSWARTARTAWPRSTPRCCARPRSRTWPRCSPSASDNKTNGVTPRRWLLLRTRRSPASSPRPSATAGSPTSASCEAQAARRRPELRDAFRAAKRRPSRPFAEWLRRRSGQTVDPDTIFDSQVKRIHEYKRQLLNALRIVVLYNRLRENPASR